MFYIHFLKHSTDEEAIAKRTNSHSQIAGIFQAVVDKIPWVISRIPHFHCSLCRWTTMVWIRLRVFISFNSVYFFCMETTVVSVSFANFHFCRQSSLCMWMTLVWISLASFHYFGQSFLCIWIASLWISLAKFHFFGQCSLCEWMVLVWISFANSHFFGQSFLECEIPWYELAL